MTDDQTATHSFMRLVPLTLAVLLALAPRGARAAASPEDRAAAQSLFEESMALIRQGKFEDACQKLATSQRLDPAVGTLLNLGRCYEKIGRTASAWLVYVDAATAAKNTAQPDRERTAREAAARLSPQVPKLIVVVPPTAAPEGLEIKRDGVPLSRSLWNLATPVDPADHELAFAAPGRKPATLRLRAEPGKQLTVNAPALEVDPIKPVVVTGGDGEPSQRAVYMKRGAIAAAALAVVGLGVGTGFGLAARSDKATADQTCMGNQCFTKAGQDANDSAHTHATVSTISVGVGAVALVGAVVLYRLAVTDSAKTDNKIDAGKAPPKGALGDVSWLLRASPDGRAGVLSLMGEW